MPSETACRFHRLCRRSPAQVRSTSDTANCAPTRRRRVSKLDEPVVRAPVIISGSRRVQGGRQTECHAAQQRRGEAEQQNPHIERCRRPDAGCRPVRSATNRRAAARAASRQPATPPARPRAVFRSASAAPFASAPRRARPEWPVHAASATDRASIRFATLEQAISSTAKTAASSVHDATRKSPVCRSRRLRT